MSSDLRPPDDVYWHFRRLKSHKQDGAECTSQEDGCLYRVRKDRVICRVVNGQEQETIDSLPYRAPTGGRVMTGANWGFRMHISVLYQQVIAPCASQQRRKVEPRAE